MNFIHTIEVQSILGIRFNRSPRIYPINLLNSITVTTQPGLNLPPSHHVMSHIHPSIHRSIHLSQYAGVVLHPPSLPPFIPIRNSSPAPSPALQIHKRRTPRTICSELPANPRIRILRGMQAGHDVREMCNKVFGGGRGGGEEERRGGEWMVGMMGSEAGLCADGMV